MGDMTRPFAQSADNNKAFILSVLRQYLVSGDRVLEIGSGTGQHAAWFSGQLDEVCWQPSDVIENHEAIKQWIMDIEPSKCRQPVLLDVDRADHWYEISRLGMPFSACYSANTAHIMAWNQVKNMFSGVAGLLDPGGVFFLYGPFNRNDEFTSPGNAKFHDYLQSVDPVQGIRNDQEVFEFANSVDLCAIADHDMPSNNRILVFQKG